MGVRKVDKVEATVSNDPSLQLITYQLGELSKAVEKMSVSLDHNSKQLNDRITTLELWRASYKGATSDRRLVMSTVISWVLAVAALVAATTAVLRHP